MPLDTTAEQRLVFTVLKAAIGALATAVGRNTEIVLHDLNNPSASVVYIANGHVSGRRMGSPVIGGPEQDRGFSAVMQASADQEGTDPVVISDYPTTIDGRTLRSATAVFRDSSGHPFASLCVNADLSGLSAAQAFLEQLQPMIRADTDQPAEPADMGLLMSQVIQDAVTRVGSGKMNKQAKVEAVRMMQERGLFIVKGGVEKAAVALGVTRFTVYNYLEEIRSNASAIR
ncbi:helix-turn-helix transcriptional regulator [Pseudomonas putida]|uniref:helix-turn-helix transcriptional regulator n=1 Tax=Pseudomonas putida TaxID=303 RepID=UPI003F3D20BA